MGTFAPELKPGTSGIILGLQRAHKGTTLELGLGEEGPQQIHLPFNVPKYADGRRLFYWQQDVQGSNTHCVYIEGHELLYGWFNGRKKLEYVGRKTFPDFVRVPE